MRHLQGLTSFLEAASAGSFTAAAARLGLSPAAVSKNVIKLEAELGVRLFNRHTRRIRLTPEGEAFAEQARAALRALDDALAGVREAQAEPSGKVRISVGAAFGRQHVMPALPALLARHPRLEIELTLDNRNIDLVAEGYDIGIRGGVVRDSSLVSRFVCALALVASPDYLARRGMPQTAAELAGHECIGVRFASGGPATWKLRSAPRRARRGLAAAGAAVGQRPRGAAGPGTRRRRHPAGGRPPRRRRPAGRPPGAGAAWPARPRRARDPPALPAPAVPQPAGARGGGRAAGAFRRHARPALAPAGHGLMPIVRSGGKRQSAATLKGRSR